MINTPISRETSDRDLFDSIADKYFNKDLVPSARVARQHRLMRSLEAAKAPKSCVLLEVGCGGGFSSEYLTGYYSDYYGVDYSEKLIEYAKARHERTNVHFYSKNIKDFHPTVGVDVILLIGVLHHMEDIPSALKRMLTMLQPGGLLIANEPHPGNPFFSAVRAVRKRIDHNYSADQRELSVKELKKLYEDSGFEGISIIPQGLFSTPFAEVAFGPQLITKPLSQSACLIDGLLESLPASLIAPLSWNVVAVGRRPR